MYWASLTEIHLNRLSENLLIYSSKGFGCVTITDSFPTGSNLMPQKRNRDSLELMRRLDGSLLRHCCILMVTMKNLLSIYNKDMHNDIAMLFSGFDKLTMHLKVVRGTIETLNKVNLDKRSEALSMDMFFTDVASHLVRFSMLELTLKDFLISFYNRIVVIFCN